MKEIKCLDHGHVRLLNISGMFGDKIPLDQTPAQAARMSFGRTMDNLDKAKDEKLTEYLVKNRHDTPMESIQVWYELKLPIFVARQFHRTRTQSINEISGRYVQLPAEWYIPEEVSGRPDNIKQGRGKVLLQETQERFKWRLKQACVDDYEAYLDAMDSGVAPEMARNFLHVNHYTVYSTSMNLRNLFHFLSLRMDSHAQYEAQVYANAMFELLKEEVPFLAGLFYRNNFGGKDVN